MNVTTKREATARRRLVRATISLAAIAAVALGASSLPTSAATLIARSHDADIGAGATRLVIHVNRGLNAAIHRYSRYSTNDEATIAAIIDRANALPKAPSRVEMCPMDVGATLTLSFSRHASKPYAIVIADPGGCGRVLIRDYHANGTLEDSAAVGGGEVFSAYVATQLDIRTLQTL